MIIDPAGPPQAYKTYGFAAPLATHWRPATCEEVGCPDYARGWRTIVPADSPQAAYIRTGSGRRFAEERQPGGLAAFTFGPGQPCFKAATHRIRTGREHRFYVRDGDWRVRARPVELAAAQWQEQFAEHQGRLAARLERG